MLLLQRKQCYHTVGKQKLMKQVTSPHLKGSWSCCYTFCCVSCVRHECIVLALVAGSNLHSDSCHPRASFYMSVDSRYTVIGLSFWRATWHCIMAQHTCAVSVLLALLYCTLPWFQAIFQASLRFCPGPNRLRTLCRRNTILCTVERYHNACVVLVGACTSVAIVRWYHCGNRLASKTGQDNEAVAS